jgi:hypothetical protein
MNFDLLDSKFRVLDWKLEAVTKELLQPARMGLLRSTRNDFNKVIEELSDEAIFFIL